MLTTIHPKLPMRNLQTTSHFYIKQLGFRNIGSSDFKEYLMVQKDEVEIHFFLFEALNPLENYGQVYIRTNDINTLYNTFMAKEIAIHPNAPLSLKPWGQKEFSVLDPDNNLLTFGQAI